MKLSDGHVIKVVALETDLFFAVKIQDTLKRAGYETRVTRSASEFESALRGGEYTVGLVDFASRGVDWRASVRAARAAGAPVIVYGPHVDLKAQAEARASGATRVIANSRLAELPAVIGHILVKTESEAEPDDNAQSDIDRGR